MIELILVILRYAFLVILYIFIIAIFRILAKDLSGTKYSHGNSGSNYQLIVRERGESANLQLGHILPLDDYVVIGRYADSHIAIADPHISAQHAAIRQERDALILEDLGSTNGTFLNGVRIKGRKRLQPGDMLRLGDVTFEVVGWENESSSSY